MKPAYLLHRLTIVAGLLLATVPLAAQTEPKPATPPASSPEESNSETVMLDKFNVTPANDHGYTSNETTTGTRVRANLRDLPFSVNVITSEFINDFAAFEFNDQVSNVSSLSTSEVQGEYQLRGFPITTQLVDGFRRLGLIDNVNIDRIDVIKGPSASVYGYIQPGGVVNITTRKPLKRHEDSVSVYAGDYDFFRVQAYSTGPVGDSNKLFYRVDLADQHRQFEQQFKSTSRYYGAVQLLYKPSANTSINVKVDDVYQHEHRGNQLAYLKLSSTAPNAVVDPFRPNAAGTNRFINNYFQGLAYANNPYSAALYNISNSGPQEFNDRRMLSGTLVFEHRFNEVFSVREGVNYFTRKYYRLLVEGLNYQIPTGVLTPGVSGTISGQQPEYDRIPQDNIASQTDLTAAFHTGPISHQMLLTVDYSGEYDRNINLRMDATNAAAQPVTNLDPNNPNWNFTTYQQNPALYNQVQKNTWDAVYDYGVFLNEHASMLHSRLNVVAGLRLDWIDTKLTDYSVFNYGTGTFRQQSFSAKIRHYPSHQVGISYRVIDPITLFANHSNSLNPQPNYIAGSGQIAPNSTSKGFEFGARVALLKDNSLYFDITHYNINLYHTVYQTSTSVTDINTGATGSVTSFVDIARQNSTGDEFNLNWQATKNLQLSAYYSYDEARIREASLQQLLLVGTPTRRVPQNQVGGALRYQFRDGFLKGFFIAAKINYFSKSSVNISGGRTATAAAGASQYVNNPLPNGLLPWPQLPAGATVPANLTTRFIPGSVGPSGSLATSVIDPQLVHLPDGRENIYNAPYATTDIGAGYSFKTRHFGHKVQLNVKNFFDKHYTYGSGIVADPITYVASYTLKY